MTLAFKDANSKLLDVVRIADIDAEERFVDSLAKTLRMRYGHSLEAEVWLRF